MKVPTTSLAAASISLLLTAFAFATPVAAEHPRETPPAVVTGAGSIDWAEQKFWIDQSTKKALRATSDPEVWTVLTSPDEKDWTAVGPARILASIEVVPPTGATAEALEKGNFRLVDRQMVVALVGADQEEPRYLTAMVMRFERPYTDHEGTPIRYFVPVLVSLELEKADNFARDMANVYNGLPPGEPASRP